MTLKNQGLGSTMGLGSSMSDSMGKTLKGNANIFGINTKDDGGANAKYNEFDDLDDDEDDRDEGSDEEPNHDSPAGKSHDKANAIMAEVAKNEADN